ncbi:MAG TPA: hypothetical protein VEQ42_12720 [Pyrinomonadaceae bacterium]|nr:hypothetical protein [Pyrinomonadaceae bacterium]
MGTNRHVRTLVRLVLRAALVAALAGGVWSVYRRLPRGPLPGQAGGSAETRLRLVLRRPAGKSATAETTSFQLYPVDVWAVRRAAVREFRSEPRPGEREDEFVRMRLRRHPPLEVRLDERGTATVVVPSGKWWVHLTLPGETELTWRLPVNVAGREQTVELTEDNVYMRAKRF